MTEKLEQLLLTATADEIMAEYEMADMIEELIVYYESAGFTDYYETTLVGATSEEIEEVFRDFVINRQQEELDERNRFE